MNEIKRYVVILFTKKLNFLIPVIEEQINKNTPFYHTFNISDTGFITFLSRNDIETIKAAINKAHPKQVFLIIDTTNRGVNFDMSFDNSNTIEQLFLLDNDETNNQEVVLNDDNLELDDLLDLLKKNGWKSLTDLQKQKLENYSKEE